MGRTGKKQLVPRARLTPRQIAQIQVDSGCSEKTIRNWARGEAVKGATDARIRKAATRFGLELEAPASGPPS